jgi:hypothetical protein
MNTKTISYIFLVFIAILGWNAFLIQRDTKLYKAYYREQASQNAGKPLVSNSK